MNSCIDKTKYALGESIGMYFLGDTATDLENNDFIVSIINPFGTAIEVLKADCAKVQDNEYYYEIENTTTKTMKTGNYKMEIYLGTNYTLIFKEDNYFELEDSYSKKFVV